MSLLLQERPVVVQPSLVRRLGLLEAAIVQQLHYWSERATRVHDGHSWVYKTYQEWSDEIGVSAKMARGAMDRLRKDGIVIATQNPADPRDRTLWWRIDYAAVESGAPSDPGGTPGLPAGDRPSAPGGTSNAGASECRTESTSESTSHRARGRAPTTDPNEIPDGFPAPMAEALEAVYSTLTWTAQSRGAQAPARAAIARAMMKPERQRKPFAAVAEKVSHWLVYGNGQRAQCKDVVARWRDWCDSEPDHVPLDRPAIAANSNVRSMRLSGGAAKDGWGAADILAIGKRMQAEADGRVAS